MIMRGTILVAFAGIVMESWRLFVEMAPYLFLGFVIAGLLHVYIPERQILKYLGNSAGKIRSALHATLLGIPIPLCSCGVVPTALSLQKKGATKGATLSFLISTPETGVDSITITYALLDPIMTVFRPLATLVTALSAGIAENFLNHEELPLPEQKAADKKNILMMQPLVPLAACSDASCSCQPSPVKDSVLSGPARFKDGLRYAFVELLGDISKWLVIGIILAGIISYAVPYELVSSYLGGGIASMMFMLIVGIPLYICATASTPLAAALIAKGMSPGTAFVFLLAGPATNAATITMVTKFLGKKSAAIYLGTIAICSLGFGLLLDLIYFRMGIEASAVVGSASEILPEPVKIAFALALIPFIIHGISRKQCRQ
ncbi:SO_0444 family Cu/Zn efflux transporter [Methanolobus sp.]|uniref:SO_0444 family Cu/Zn efflux transporter n=1 Tax=Methanolobus sp. TaxID=1874737 RepID=UPI0025FF3689|nr:SO_0444 family Cu/Zn efflux transporter [Methanolobus sp.]